MAIETTTTIAGVIYDDVEKITIRKSMSANNSSGTFEIFFENRNGIHSNDFNIGDEVVITADVNGDKSFFPFVFPFAFTSLVNLISGNVEEIRFTGKGSVDERLVIRGRDFTALLQDSTVQPAVFNDDEVSTIVTNILTDNVPGVTSNNVVPTEVTLDNIQFNHTPVFDAYRQLADQSNSIFFVDDDKDLNFIRKGVSPTSIILDDNNITKATFRTIERELANHVFVYGSRRLTGWQNDFTADGGSIYNLDFKPHNTNVFVGGSDTPKQGGIFEGTVGDVGSPIQYLVHFDQQRIIFVSGTEAGDNIPISGTDAINIPYERESPIVKFGIDRTSEAEFGKKEIVIVDKNIKDPRAAIDRVNSELLERSSPMIEGTVSVNNLINVVPGNTLTVNLPTQNINNVEYEVLEVAYNIDRTTELGCNTTTVRLNKRIIKLEDTIKQLILDVKQLQADDSVSTEFLTRLEKGEGDFPLERQWFIKTRTVGNSFVLGHSVNGLLGSPQLGTNGSQIVLGSASAGAFSIVKSGGDF